MLKINLITLVGVSYYNLILINISFVVGVSVCEFISIIFNVLCGFSFGQEMLEQSVYRQTILRPHDPLSKYT